MSVEAQPLVAGKPDSAYRAAATLHDKRSTYAEILRSTTLIGGSTALNVAIAIVRTKAMAMLLGPAGFGLMGVYSSIADLARSVAGMGINSSGVRQIAESVSSNDAERIARTAFVLRRTAVALGLLGALLLVLLATPISVLTFKTDTHAGAVALLSVVVFLQLVADGQSALVQGTRRISDLAKISVLGALIGTLASIPVVYYLREDGVVPALVVVAAAVASTSWWYGRKVPIEPCLISGPQVRDQVAALLKLGLAFMASGLLMLGAAYVVRLLVLHHAGLAAAGYYQAAWTLGGLYVGFVLQAMGADFYPRLVGAVHDHSTANRLVNEQAQVSLLLAGPGVVATLTFAQLVIAVFYSGEFAAAVDVLQWICLGMALRVISWPLGYVIVATNRRSMFFAAELAWTIVNVTLAWICVEAYGLTGAGIAFFGSYVFHGFLVYALVRRLTGFRWSGANRRVGMLFLGMIGLVFCAFHVMPPVWATACGVVVMLASGINSIRTLATMVSPADVPRPIRSLLAGLKALGSQGKP
jgi:enterobacterial common antigen flippase